MYCRELPKLSRHGTRSYPADALCPPEGRNSRFLRGQTVRRDVRAMSPGLALHSVKHTGEPHHLNRRWATMKAKGCIDQIASARGIQSSWGSYAFTTSTEMRQKVSVGQQRCQSDPKNTRFHLFAATAELPNNSGEHLTHQSFTARQSCKKTLRFFKPSKSRNRM